MSEPAPGDVFAGHRIESVAGRGGMGIVFRATQLDLDRPVALKLIASQLAQDPEFRERFVRESRAAASIDHPNVIPIYYTGEHEGALYIAMRYVEGDDLRTLVRREGGLSPQRAANLVNQIGAALDAAHARGIVHRDVKPANVLLGAGDHAYLTDFGLTKRLHSQSGTSRTGQWVGTLGYVAPEQIRGERVDARADVYALGCVLYHALSGSTPYQRDSDEATLWAHLNDEPPPVTQTVPGVPAEFEAVIARALAKDPDDRFPSAGDLGRAAVAAAGRPEVREPERLVARGAAAPAADAETVVSPTHMPTVPAGAVAAGSEAQTAMQPPAPAPARRRTLPIAIAAVLVLAGAAAGALALHGGGDGGGGTDQATTSSTAKAAGAAPAVKTIPVGRRPNDITIADGKAWVTSFSEGHLSTIDLKTGRTGELPLPQQRGTASLAAGYGSLWVANATDQTITRIPLSTRRPETPIQLPPGRVVSVAVGQRGVWVGSRGPRVNNVVRINPSTGTIQKTLSLRRGVQDMTVGEGSLWVVDRGRRSLTRVRVRDGHTSRIDVRAGAYAIEVGAGGVWVSSDAGNSVTRIDPRSQDRQEIPVGNQPQGIGIGGGSVWVANRLDNTVNRIDPKTFQVVGDPIRVGVNPFAVAVRAKLVLVTDLGDNAVTRFTAP